MWECTGTRRTILCGDVDFADAEPVVSAITPVPGGVGPMTIAMLMNNCVETIRTQGGKDHDMQTLRSNYSDDQMVCPECGAEVQIVPDYNPLDDVLAREVRGSVEGATRQIQTDDIRRYRRGNSEQNANATRVLQQEEMDRIRRNLRSGTPRGTEGNRRNSAERRNTGEIRRQRQNTGSTQRQRQNTDELRRARQNTGDPNRSRQNTSELKRQRQQKRLEAAKRKRRNLLIALFAVLALIIAGIVVVYQNSYTGMIRKGYNAIQTRDYTAG